MSPTVFRVVDLTQADALQAAATTPLQSGTSGTVDLESLRNQLGEIRDALNPVLAEQTAETGLHLDSIQLDLTVGLEGRIWFVAKGTGEASLRLIWSRGS